MLKHIDNFKSITLYCKIDNDLYYANCYKILNTRDLRCKDNKELINKFKPTGLIYKLKLLQGYYHEYKNLFVFDNKLVHIEYIKNFQLFKTYIKYRDKFKNVLAAYDLIPVFIELYNEQKNIITSLDQKYINNLNFTLTLKGITFKKYSAYQKLVERVKQECNSTIQFGKYISFSFLFGNKKEVKQINLYIKLNLELLYKILNFVY